MTGRFDGKVALVTGGASGIGLACVKRFASEGARVVVADRDVKDEGDATTAAKAAGAPDAWACACDVSVEAQVAACVTGAMQRFGRLDVIVNNAGLMTFKALTDLDGDDWNRVLAVDLLGAFYFIKNGFLNMKPGSAIVNVASIHARETEPMVAPYAAGKAALLSLTRSAAIEGKARGIRVNAVLPGAVDTPMLWNNPNVKSGVEKIDKADVGTPDQLAAAIAFLASDDAAFVQGTGLTVDGGRLDHL
ncbi:MAG: SDR family oxidoreductase [Gemmatimonadota bacterium]|nr:SDR family oxidoreductase [Gemmatimonadota bacterium]